MYRPSKNLVVAREDLPARFRPGNQARLMPTAPSPGAVLVNTDTASMLPGMGEVRSGNGTGSNGLASGSADLRLQQAAAIGKARDAARQAQITATGKPTANARPVIRMSMTDALAAMPAAPAQGALVIQLMWAGDSIAAERTKLQRMYDMRPLKAWNKYQTFVTSRWGNDAHAAQAELNRQPIIQVVGIAPYQAQPTPIIAQPGIQWENVASIPRAGDRTRWTISKAITPTGTRYAVSLYRDRKTSTDLIVRSDNLATEADARNYIKAYEVRHGNLAQPGRPNATLFWAGLRRETAGNHGAAARRSSSLVPFVNSPAPYNPAAFEPSGYSNLTPAEARKVRLDGLGTMDMGAMTIAALAIGGVFLLTKNRRGA